MRAWQTSALCCLALSGGATPTAAASDALQRSSDIWSELKLPNPQFAGALRRALLGAAERLAKPGCRRVLTDFRDAQGRSLQARLAEAGVSAPRYLRRIAFREGWGTGHCEANDRLAFTRPGAGTVWVCGGKFELAMTTNARWAEATLIHEALHTLGLGEGGSAASLAITRRVLDRCGD